MTDLEKDTIRNKEKESVVAAARRLAGSLSQYDDGISYDEMRYEALKERYGPFDMDHKENFNE